jgi:predicted RNA-binding protein
VLYFGAVDIIRFEDGLLYMKNLFGEERYYEGKIEEISLLKHKIILRKRSIPWITNTL